MKRLIKKLNLVIVMILAITFVTQSLVATPNIGNYSSNTFAASSTNALNGGGNSSTDDGDVFWPAAVAAAIGVVAVVAFVIGVVDGWNAQPLSNSFSLKVNEIKQYNKLDFAKFDA